MTDKSEKSFLAVDWGKIIPKKEVLTACTEIMKGAKEYTLHMCDPSRQLDYYKNPKDHDSKTALSVFKSKMGMGVFDGLHAGITAMVSTISQIEKLVATSWSDKELRDGLTYKKLTTLQLIQRASFVSQQARRFIDHILASAEVYALSTMGQKPGTAVILSDEKTAQLLGTKKEQSEARENLLELVDSLRLFTVTAVGLTDGLNALPDVTATSKTDATLINAHDGNMTIIDPFQLRVFLNRSYNSEGLGLFSPLYHIKAFFVDAEIEAYKMAKDELELAEYRKMHLERLLKGEHSPKLEEQIAYEVNRISKLKHLIDSKESKYG